MTNPESFGLRHLALKVSDIKEIVRSLTEKGFSPEEIRFDSFTGEMMTFVKDPDGLPIELHE
jgi:glyoxylase I family protein